MLPGELTFGEVPTKAVSLETSANESQFQEEQLEEHETDKVTLMTFVLDNVDGSDRLLIVLR